MYAYRIHQNLSKIYTFRNIKFNFFSEKYCRDCAEIMQRFPHRRGYAAIARRLCNSKRAQRLCRGHAALHNLGVLQRSCRGRAAIAQSKFRMAFNSSQRFSSFVHCPPCNFIFTSVLNFPVFLVYSDACSFAESTTTMIDRSKDELAGFKRRKCMFFPRNFDKTFFIFCQIKWDSLWS